MGTMRFYIRCNDCGKLYMVRYGLGNNYPQKASFHCNDCANVIEIGYVIFGKQILKGGIIANDENLLTEKDLPIKNLHPEIPTNKEDEDNPYFFQTMDLFSKLHRKKVNLFQFKDEQFELTKFFDTWPDIEFQLRLVSTRGEEKLKEIANMSYPEFTDRFENWSLQYLNGEQLEKLKLIDDELQVLDNSELIEYIKNENQFLRRIFNLCKTYMDCRDQLQASIFDLKFDLERNENMIVNVNWNEINKVYGDLYETIGDLFILPTMINNLKSGRRYNEFSSEGFNLKKYLETDKANRGKNFEANSNLAYLLNSYHSWLRNGTHHNNSTLDQERHQIELGTGKGGGEAKIISLADYVKNCNELFACGLYLSSLIIKIKNYT